LSDKNIRRNAGGEWYYDIAAGEFREEYFGCSQIRQERAPRAIP
jgi:hypothetical protein